MRQISVFNPRRLFADEFFENLLSNNLNYDQIKNLDVDLYEDQENVVAKFSGIVGFDEKNIEISIEDSVLTVTGGAQAEEVEEDKKRKYYRKEIRNESFSRSITLPVKVKADRTEAELKKGVLTITMPKAEEIKPQKIMIKAS